MRIALIQLGYGDEEGDLQLDEPAAGASAT